MSWNNAYERKKFNARIKREIAEYQAAGMTEEQIAEIVGMKMLVRSMSPKVVVADEIGTIQDIDAIEYDLAFLFIKSANPTFEVTPSIAVIAILKAMPYDVSGIKKYL